MLLLSRNTMLKLKVLLKLSVLSLANFLPSNQIKKFLLPLLNWTRSDLLIPFLLLCKLLLPSQLNNLKMLSKNLVKLKNLLNKLLKMLVNKKSKLNLILKLSQLKLLLKENHFQLQDKMLKDNYLKTNKPSISKRRERKMLQMNFTLPLLVKIKKKKIVISLELHTLKNLNTDNKKSQSLDKLKKSSLQSFQVSRSIFKKDKTNENFNIFY